MLYLSGNYFIGHGIGIRDSGQVDANSLGSEFHYVVLNCLFSYKQGITDLGGSGVPDQSLRNSA